MIRSMARTPPSDHNVLSFAAPGRHKPDSIKKQQGTYRADRAAPEAEYKDIEKAIEPVAPSWMVDPLAQDYYCQAFRLMRDAGVLTFADVAIIEIYAAERCSIQRRYEAMYKPDPENEGEYIIVPNMGPGTEKLNAFRVLSAELGFTPVSRHKAAKAGGAGAGKPKNEFDEI